VDLRAYRKLFYETNFWKYFQNTIVVSAITTVIVVTAGVIGAYSLTATRFPPDLVARMTLLAYMFPPIIMLVPSSSSPRARPRNSLLGLASLHLLSPSPTRCGSFAPSPVDPRGAGSTRPHRRGESRQALCYVVAPLALPGIIATAIFTFIVAWNDFLFALVLIGRDELRRWPSASTTSSTWRGGLGVIMAAGVMVTIPPSCSSWPPALSHRGLGRGRRQGIAAVPASI